jgi:hypothetical protein
VFGVPTLAANVLAVVTMTIVNFGVADRWVFKRSAVADQVVASLAFVVLWATPAVGQPTAKALEEWNRYVASTEARLAHTPARAPSHLPGDITADGLSVPVDSGTISDWRGAVFLRGITVAVLLDRLQNPGTPPPQEDVLWSRVLARGPDTLRVFIRLVRRTIVTVTYDTEHDMTFTRQMPSLATARSVATRIAETGGEDHGFLWRLNSYWRYEQVDGGVWVTVESLTLSRHVPSLIRPVASPIVTRIARESMVRTLQALRAYVAG